MTDEAEREAQIRDWVQRNGHMPMRNEPFLLRRLDEARTEISELNDEITRLARLAGESSARAAERQREIARLRAPPSAPVIERVEQAIIEARRLGSPKMSPAGVPLLLIAFGRLRAVIGHTIEQAERAARAEPMRALGFAASVIKSGESWTATCEREIGDLLRANRTIAKPSG